MLTAGDEYPIHQTPEPVAYAGSDRNFYDRYFYNGYSADGSVFFAAAMGSIRISTSSTGRSRCCATASRARSISRVP